MYIISQNEELTTDKVKKIINNYETTHKPRLLRYRDYYDGRQAILQKTVTNEYKPCNRIVTNYCYNIVQNYLGYMTGIGITYSSNDEGFDNVRDILNYNDIKTEDSDLLLNALIYGVSFEINYLDADLQQRFKVLDCCIPVYSDTLDGDLMYVIRYYRDYTIDDIVTNNPDWIIEIYSADTISRYKATSQFGEMTLIDVPAQHYFGQVPITVFKLNNDMRSVFDKVMTLQDAYNTLLSSEVDDFEAFCDAYLVLKGADIDETTLATMKENRVLVLDADGSAEYLNKSITDTQINNMLQNVNDTIHKIANSPDFNDEKLLAQSGIAMRYKLVGFENSSSAIESNMKKALQRRIELICAILELIGTTAIWRDVAITFTRNLPVNTLEAAQVINSLRGIVSDKTLLSLLPFVSDPDAELEQLQAEQESKTGLYSFDNGGVA